MIEDDIGKDFVMDKFRLNFSDFVENKAIVLKFVLRSQRFSILSFFFANAEDDNQHFRLRGHRQSVKVRRVLLINFYSAFMVYFG